MAHFYAESDIDLSVIRSKKVGVIGYGSHGRAHSLNLRDSGLDVAVGLYEGSASIAVAKDDGLPVCTTEELVQSRDVLMLCLPDVRMAHVYRESIQPHVRKGQALLFAHGFNIHYGLIEAPPDVDVVLVAPKGAGPGVRANYEGGSGVAGLIAVAQDATGSALQVGLGYAWGLGCARVMLMQTTFAEETETDLFGEQAVLCGGIPEVIRAGFETLVEAGYSPEAAYFECLHETKIIVDLLYARGLAGMREAISDTAEWGGYVSGKRIIDSSVRMRMERILEEIRSGEFTRAWISEDAGGRKQLDRLRKAGRGGTLEEVGADLRKRMGLT